MGAVQPWVQFVGLVAVAVIAGVSSWLVARMTVKPAHVTASAAVQDMINDGFRELMAARDAADAKRDKEWQDTAENLMGEIRNLTQHVESLETILRKRGLGHIVPPRPKRGKPQQFTVMNGGKREQL